MTENIPDQTVENQPEVASEEPKQDSSKRGNPLFESLSEQIENIERVWDLTLTTRVTIGSLVMSLNEVLNISPGAIIELDKKADEMMPLMLGDEKIIAKGEVVTIGENLGLRVLEIN